MKFVDAKTLLNESSDSVPVVVALPYSPKADFIEISRNGVTLKRESLNAQILEGLILSIPPEAFVGSSEKNLNFALNIVAKIQLKLNSKLPFEASGLLQDLLEFIRSKTVASVRGGDGSQYLRSSLIDQINAILCDVVPQRNCHK